MRILCLLCGCYLCAFGDTIVLRSGHTIQGEKVDVGIEWVSWQVGTGITQVPAADVLTIEPEDASLLPKAVATPLEPASTPVPIPLETEPLGLLRAAALRHGLPPEFVISVARAESGLQKKALSPKGAIGLMQLMPGTAKQLGANPHDPAQNVDAGVRFLKQLLVQYKEDGALALAAYNAGPGAVAKYGGLPPYLETQQYVRRVLDLYLKTTKK